MELIKERKHRSVSVLRRSKELKRFRLRVVLTMLLAAGLVVVFGWLVALRNYRSLSLEAEKEEPLTREAVNDTLHNLSEAWNEYESKIISRYEVEAVFASFALQSIMDDADAIAESQEDGLIVSIQDGELVSSDPVVSTLGLDASLFQGKHGSFAAPNQPSTFVAYSRIGDTSDYFVKWYEDTIIDEIVKETVDVPAILRWTEITYDVPAVYVSCDPDSGEITEILYKNNRFFSDCESLADLGLTQKDLEKDGVEASGSLLFDEARYSYVSGKSAKPAGYVVLLEPVPNLFAKAFVQGGYMIAALIILLTSLLVAGFSLYPYVLNNILTPEEERAYTPSHVRSVASVFGILGAVIIALCGMFSYALNEIYDDALRGRGRLEMMQDSISMYTERYNRNIQSFHDIYLDYGNLIAEFLDTYPQLRNSEVLSTLADSISASSITLYDSDGHETVSSGRWNGLELSEDPDSSTYDFRRILRGVPSIVHDPEIDEVTGLNEMRLGIQIHDDADKDQCGVMMICVDIPTMTNHEIDPEQSVRQILSNLSDDRTTLWIADAHTGRILVSSKEQLEGDDITSLGFGESDLKDTLMKTQSTEEGSFLITSASMETPEILDWTGVSAGMIAYCKGPKTPVLLGMIGLAATGCILFLLIYSLLSWLVFTGYTVDFFETYKHVKGAADPKKKLNRIRRAIASATPARKGIVAMEITTAFALLEIVLIVNSNSSAAKNTVYRYISAGDWERGFNLFSIAAIVILLSKTAMLVIGLRFLLTICATFSGSKGKTIFRLIANVILYVALIFFLIKVFEYLGFSPATIVAGIGSLGLAISLGAQNFVADIIAGLTYVFEGTVHVGDNVKIAVPGSPVHRGKVVEVGVRCVKLLTREGDLITCSNRDIKSIQNRTQLNSLVICEIEVSTAIPADEMEQILKTELPKTGQNDRRILSGPTYNGIISIGNGTMVLSVSAECSEEDYYYVRDRLNVCMQRIFMEHGYSI